MGIERMKGESAFEQHKRLIYGKLVDRTLDNFDFSELSEAVYGQQYSSDFSRRMMYGSAKTLQLMDKENNAKSSGGNARRLSDIEQKRVELQQEREKLKAEKSELDRMIREMALDDMIMERLADSVQAIQNVPFPIGDSIDDDKSPRREGVLAFGDEHYGAKFTIYGLGHEIINEYSTEIAEERMWRLLGEVIKIVKRENLTVLNVYNMGDFTDGVLRAGQLKKLELGVVDSTVRYMELLSRWLNELSKEVKVVFQMVNGNHSELRMLGQKKGAFKDENMGKVVAAYIKARLADNPNFVFLDNPTGMVWDSVLGFNILGIHGEVKGNNLENAIKNLETVYRSPIDYLIAGHLHHLETNSIGYRRAVIRVPSIVGTDDFAVSINKVSDPGAVLFIVEEGAGKTITYDIKLSD